MSASAITQPTRERKEEIRALLALSPEDVCEQAGDTLAVFDDVEGLHRAMAMEIVSEIETGNSLGRPTRLILPIGPTGQYPYVVKAVRARRISLSNCHLFFMDEYRGEDGNAVPVDHPLSFKGEAGRLLLEPLGELAPPPANIHFPDEATLGKLAGQIDALGGLDACFGGIGIHGHLAFNEPEPGVADTGPRIVRLNDYTVTLNAVRAEVGGNLECFPREAFSLGMRQILGARRIVLACRNGTPYDWANTVLRLALFGKPGDDYPVTHARSRNYNILTDRNTLACPRLAI